MVKIVCDRCGREVYMKYPDLTGRAKIGFEEYDLCKHCILDIKRFINQGRADCKTENNSEKPNNSTISKMEQVEDETKTQMKTQNSNLTFEKADEPQTCDTCKYGEDKHRYAHICNECGVGINNYELKDEPQMREATAEERQAVRDYIESISEKTGVMFYGKDEPQTDCPWK